MGTGNLLSYSLLMSLGYVTIFLFPLIVMSWLGRKKKLPFMMFMVSMAIMGLIAVFRIHSMMDVYATAAYIVIICLLNGICWLMSELRRRKNR